MALRRLRADLHIHTCLSPCGGLSMSPRAVAEAARAAGIDLIAVTDHNATGNAAAVAEAAGGAGPAVLPGIELTTAEEIHLLGLFEAGTDLARFQEEVYAQLPEVPEKRKFVEDQVLVGADDYVAGFDPHCLFGATLFPLREAVALIHGHGGLAVACHVDREAFSVLSQLGFIPPGLELDAVEVSPRLTVAEALRTLGPFGPLPVVRFSDAHEPGEIGRAVTDILAAAPSLAELRLALAGRDGRKVLPS